MRSLSVTFPSYIYWLDRIIFNNGGIIIRKRTTSEIDIN